LFYSLGRFWTKYPRVKRIDFIFENITDNLLLLA